MPDDFPIVELMEFMAEARRVLLPGGNSSAAWQEFGGASNLIGWRFRASAEAWDEHRRSIEMHGSGRNHDDLYLQERSLFHMFSAGVACIESTVYALAAASSHLSMFCIAFGTKEQRACSPKQLVAWLSPHANAAPIVAALNSLLADPKWVLWVELRNRMTHRSNLPRRHFAYVGSEPPPMKQINYAPTSSTPEVEAELADFDALHQWLARALQALLVAGTGALRGA